MIRITRTISIDESEIHERFIRSSGPGGQNVNKVSTAVQLRFDVKGSPSLPEDVRLRLGKLAGRRMTDKGVLIIEARRYRHQEKNRTDARERLVTLNRKATEKPKPRNKTKPTVASKRRRLDDKRRRSSTKTLRKSVQPEKD